VLVNMSYSQKQSKGSTLNRLEFTTGNYRQLFQNFTTIVLTLSCRNHRGSHIEAVALVLLIIACARSMVKSMITESNLCCLYELISHA
jgi:hypothetical protein